MNFVLKPTTMSLTKLKSNPNSTIEQKDIEIHLQKGNNTIRLYTDQNPMPDIDYMELKKK
jgi:hypothetical protein